jgi:hypothetical protein
MLNYVAGIKQRSSSYCQFTKTRGVVVLLNSVKFKAELPDFGIHAVSLSFP